MKALFALLATTAVGAALPLPTPSRADDWPTNGRVTYSYNRPYQRGVMNTPTYVGAYSYSQVAPNGAVHIYTIPGHMTYGNDNGPAYYYPAFRSRYEAPGHVYYYYGSYGNPNAFYDNRR